MNKCFITKLPSSVDNDNLPVLGQLRINWLKQSDLTDNAARAIGLSTNDTITVKVSGAHFTDSALSANNGNVKTIKSTDGLVWLYVSNDVDAVLMIDGKYSLTELNFVQPTKDSLVRSVYFDIEEIKYLTALTLLNLTHTQVSGDISAVTNLTALTNLNLSHTQVSGDISAVTNLTALTYLSIDRTQVSGDISAVTNLTALTNLSIDRTQVSGDISALSNMTNIVYLSLNYTNVSGNVDSFASLINITDFTRLKGISLTGNMSKLPAQAFWVSQKDRKINTNFTWTAKGRQNATLLAMEGSIPFDTVSMDNMLIDQATCTLKPSAGLWEKFISVNGTRTSASDAAVTAIQNMGVTITGVTKQA